MLKRLGKSTALLLALAALATAQTIPAGTRLTVRTDSEISSATAKAGQQVRANLVRDLVVDGQTLAKAGAPVKGKVTYAKPSGRLHAPGELTVRLTSVEVNGKMVPIATSGYHAKGKSHTKSNATKIGGGAAAGAILGGVFGGGKGALIGAAAGGAAGTGVAAATGKEEAVIHAETALTFTTTSSATVK
ncbi:MAG TPA: hypothetical protein VFA89_09985 [Terriglobales bacterium]|nr:hypothetical protein [Terriglobales bacterium]